MALNLAGYISGLGQVSRGEQQARARRYQQEALDRAERFRLEELRKAQQAGGIPQAAAAPNFAALAQGAQQLPIGAPAQTQTVTTGATPTGQTTIAPPVAPPVNQSAAESARLARVAQATAPATMTPQQIQFERDRLIAQGIPAAAKDVFAAPAAVTYNAAMGIAEPIARAKARVINAVTGQQVLDPNVTYSRAPLTPAYDKIRQAEADLEARVRSGQMTEAQRLEELRRLNQPGVSSAAPRASQSLVNAVIQVESGGNPNAVSPKGAFGLMQTMPETAKNPGFGITPMRDNSPAEQLRFGTDYLNAMLQRYNGNIEYALAAYNWGPGKTDRWIANGADPAKLPTETRNYIPKVLAAMGQTPTTVTAAQQPTQPAQAPVQLAQAQTGTATDAVGPVMQSISQPAGVRTTPEQKPSVFYSQNIGAIPLERQLLDQDYQQSRAIAASRYDSLVKAGMMNEANALRDQVVTLDRTYRNNRLVLDGMQAVMAVEYGGDPRMISQVVSAYTGQQIQFQPLSDGRFRMLMPNQQGELQSRGDFTRKEIGTMAKQLFDAKFRETTAASQAEVAKLMLKAQLDLQTEIGKQNAQTIREATVKMIERGTKEREIMIGQREYKLTVDTSSGGAYLSTKDGADIFYIDPQGRTFELGGRQYTVPSKTRVQ